MKHSPKAYPADVRAPRPTIGHLRIARISYDHTPLEAREEGGLSIGQVIDEHIASTIAQGHLVSEVSLFFESQEQQELLRRQYEP
jgi:hypothetical protein